MITVVINGVDFDYPEVGDSEWGDPATKAFQSLCATTLQKVGGSFTLENDLTFGGNKGIHCLFFSSVGSDPALSGVYRLSKNELVAWRNEWNTDDFAITVDSTSGDLLIKSNELESYVDPDDGQTKYRPVLDGNGDPIPVVRRVAISGEIVNADVADSAGILESKLALDYSTDSLHQAIVNQTVSDLADTNITSVQDGDTLQYDANDSEWKNTNTLSTHVANTSNPHLTNLVNLVDTTVVTPADGDALIYDSNDSKWKNSDVVANHIANTSNPHSVTKAQVLTGDLIVNADVDNSAAIDESKLDLDYSTSSLNTAITTHTGNTNNPHSTSVSNLTDTTITSATNGDVLSYDGSKWVNSPSTSSSLSGLSDTAITTPANGDTLVYDSVSTKWENSNELSTVSSTVSSHVSNTSNPHSTNVSNLTDTTLSSLNYGDRLTYDSNTSKWFNQPNTLGALIDTGISQETNGDALVYDGVQWVNQANTVENLKDVTVSSIADKDTLLYDSNSAEWINVENSIDNLSNTDIDSNTLTENDVLVFNDQTLKWENSQIMVNHIGNISNPHLTTVAKLTDTAITTPANRDVLYYDYANSQWINYPIASAVNNLWSSSVAYSLGDIVNYAGRTYKCAVAHTSSSVFEADFYGGKWDDGNIAGTIIQNLAFASSVPYHYFDVTGTDAGAEISQATYPNLYAVIGGIYDTCYDYVNGTQYSAVAAGNFRLPDFRNTFFKNSGSSTWGAGHNAEHKHTTAYDSGVSTTHGHSYLDQNRTTPINVPGAYSGGYWHFYKKYMNTAQDDTLYTPSFNAGHYSVSGATNQVTLTYPALAMQNQGSGTTPEPNNYGTRIFIKY